MDMSATLSEIAREHNHESPLNVTLRSIMAIETMSVGADCRELRIELSYLVDAYVGVEASPDDVTAVGDLLYAYLLNGARFCFEVARAEAVKRSLI